MFTSGIHQLRPARWLLALLVATVLPTVQAPAAHAQPNSAAAHFQVQPLPALTQTVHARLGSGARHMQSTVTWFPASNGVPDRVVGTTRTWNDVKFSGFTGSVIVLFKNEHNQVVGYSRLVHPLGVDGRWTGRRWDRTDHWAFDVAPEMTRGAVGFEIAHSRGSVPRTQQQVAEARAWLQLAGDVVRLVGG